MFLLTYYVTDVIVITIIMALVIRSTREQLAQVQIIKNGFIFQNKKPLFVFSHAFGGAENLVKRKDSKLRSQSQSQRS